MKTTPYALFAGLLLLATPALAQEPIAETAEAIQDAEEGQEGQPGEDGEEAAAPEPTPEPMRVFDCAVDSAGERCTLPVSEGDSIVGTVAYKEEHTGKWIDFGWGPFNQEGQPHGCDWVLSFRERLVEERGCFQNGKRHGEWETCRLRLEESEGAAPNLKCPKTEYEMGVIVVRPPEPELEPAEEGAGEGGVREEGEKPETDQDSDKKS